MAKLAGLWADATGVDPGDNGQIAMKASSLIKRHQMRIEDAWLTGLVSWSFHHPNPDARLVLGTAIVQFLDIYEFSAGLSPECRSTSRLVANQLIAACFEGEHDLRADIAGSAEQTSNGGTREQDEKRAALAEEKRRSKVLANLRNDYHAKTVSSSAAQLQPSVEVPSAEKTLTRAEVLAQCFDFLRYTFQGYGYRVVSQGKTRADEPSFVLQNGSLTIYVMLELKAWGESNSLAPFVRNRVKEAAFSKNAQAKIASVIYFNRYAVSDSERATVTEENIAFSFNGLDPM